VENNAHAGHGSVVLDIGGDIGALMVTMPPEMVGQEVEICPAGNRPTGHVPHVAVVARPTPEGPVHSLVFPELAEGSYDLNERYRDEVAVTVAVVGGQVTYSSWPQTPAEREMPSRVA
jgi:hypothetical protein